MPPRRAIQRGRTAWPDGPGAPRSGGGMILQALVAGRIGDARGNKARAPQAAGVEGSPCRIHTPLIGWTKAEIILAGTRLGVDYGRTVSCYQADAEGRACGRCDACRLRRAGFVAAGIADPTRYQRL